MPAEEEVFAAVGVRCSRVFLPVARSSAPPVVVLTRNRGGSRRGAAPIAGGGDVRSPRCRSRYRLRSVIHAVNCVGLRAAADSVRIFDDLEGAQCFLFFLFVFGQLVSNLGSTESGNVGR